MKIGLKEGAGVVAGVVVGKFVFKSNNLLVLSALGIAGGVISHFMFNKKDASDKYIAQIQEGIDEAMEEESNFYGVNREMEFNQSLGYHTPNGEMKEQEPRDYMDVNFH